MSIVQQTYTRDKILRTRWHKRRIVNIQAPDLIVRTLGRKGLEGRFSHEKLEAQDAQTPLIDAVIIGTAIDHFGRQVIQSSTKSFPLVIWRMRRPAKIGQL